MLTVKITEILSARGSTRLATFSCPICPVFSNDKSTKDVEHLLALIGAHMRDRHNVEQEVLKFEKHQWANLLYSDFGFGDDSCGICGDERNHGGQPHSVARGDGLTRQAIIDYINGRGFRPYEETQ
jgi:hypothetical protein